MRWVNCLKTLNKLTMCLPGKTPSAPSEMRKPEVGDEEARGVCQRQRYKNERERDTSR
jgi:hypothetical protein